MDGEVTFTVYQGGLAIAEIEGSSEAGLHSFQWDMQKRVERTAAEQERMRAEDGRGGRGGRGRGRGGRGGPSAEARIRYAFSEAPAGDYRVVMSVDGRELEQTVTILRDEWWRDRR